MLVLLSEKKLDGDVSWNIESESGFLLSDTSKDSKIFYVKPDTLNISLFNNDMYVNGNKYLKEKLHIAPKEGCLTFNGKAYQGGVIISSDEKNAFLVNQVDLEDYVFAVLRSESWPGWPVEVNKVIAVAIRSYAIFRTKEAEKRKKLYHVRNDNRHQTYNGHEFMRRNSKKLRQAVEQTRGEYLQYNGKAIEAMFDSCCGGVIPALTNGKVNFKKAPYLARTCPCQYCKKCSLYSWDIEYDLHDLEAILSESFPDIGRIKSISVSKKDDAGLVKEVTIKCTKRTIEFSGKKLYSMLKGVKSFCFSISKKGKTVTISGNGYGHHIGLCQWGARQMVREFFGYEQILQFYYPGTTLVNL
ncbi:SpoIID/LytB domain-containing protein [Candidatus Dependentiae bacterium]